MKMSKKIIAALAVVLLSATSASAFGMSGFWGGNSNGNDPLIVEYEINASSIEEGVEKILGSVNAYGLEEYNTQVEENGEDSEEIPYFWMAKPLNRNASNDVEKFAPDFTKGINKGACFNKLFHQHMENNESVADAKKHAGEEASSCVENNESPLAGQFASKVRQMVLCQPKHGQLFLAKEETVFFAAGMPCHISIYQKDGKIFVSWRNIEEIAKQVNLGEEEEDLAKEVQEDMVNMLSGL
jgi:hypothetical protein